MIKQEDDIILVRNIQEHNDLCNDSLIELTNRHKPLCVDICNKFGPALDSGEYYRDLVSDAPLIIYESAKSYKPEKNVKFSSWVGNMTKYKCLSAISKLKKENYAHFEDDFQMDTAAYVEDTNKYTEDIDRIMYIIDTLEDKRIKKIFEMRLFSGPKGDNWREISEEVGLTHQACINLYNKAIELLKSKMDSEIDFV